MEEIKTEVLDQPHVAVITIDGIVYKAMPNGQYSPQCVHHDAFQLTIQANNEQECLAALKAKFEDIKNV